MDSSSVSSVPSSDFLFFGTGLPIILGSRSPGKAFSRSIRAHTSCMSSISSSVNSVGVMNSISGGPSPINGTNMVAESILFPSALSSLGQRVKCLATWLLYAWTSKGRSCIRASLAMISITSDDRSCPCCNSMRTAICFPLLTNFGSGICPSLPVSACIASHVLPTLCLASSSEYVRFSGFGSSSLHHVHPIPSHAATTAAYCVANRRHPVRMAVLPRHLAETPVAPHSSRVFARNVELTSSERRHAKSAMADVRRAFGRNGRPRRRMTLGRGGKDVWLTARETCRLWNRPARAGTSWDVW
mmetsp:Transcript_9838/g.59931  ORF Transcript_9838/g.59931 Transcript_9838/m.59931 type:complete len:301 (-) Transcript_9838:631-1533(-)